MKKLGVLASALIATAVMVGCNNPSATEEVSEKIAAKTEAELIAEKEHPSASRAVADIPEIMYISRQNVGYMSNNNGSTWNYVANDVISVSGGDHGMGNYYVRKDGEIYQKGQVIEWGDFKEVAYCAYNDKAFALDVNGALYEKRGTEYHVDFVKFEKQPAGTITAMDVDGIGNPWVILNGNSIYKYTGTWELKHKINPNSAYTSMYDIGVGDEGAYVSIGVKPMGAQFSIPEIRMLKTGESYLTGMPGTMYGTKVDVASDGYRDRVYFVTTSWQGHAMYDLHRVEADGSTTLKASGVAQNVGCAVYR